MSINSPAWMRLTSFPGIAGSPAPMDSMAWGVAGSSVSALSLAPCMFRRCDSALLPGATPSSAGVSIKARTYH